MKTKLTPTEKARYDRRVEIAKYCQIPRTLQQLKTRFNMSGISIAACLSPLICRWGIIKHDQAKKTYIRIKGVKIPKK